MDASCRRRYPGCMSHVLVKVSDETGAMFLPADTPYDRDVLFEHLQAAARAHEQVRVELDDLRLLLEHGAEMRECAHCRRSIAQGVMQFVSGSLTVCTRCARRLLDDPQFAVQ
jgi:hypothetical protein